MIVVEGVFLRGLGGSGVGVELEKVREGGREMGGIDRREWNGMKRNEKNVKVNSRRKHAFCGIWN